MTSQIINMIPSDMRSDIRAGCIGALTGAVAAPFVLPWFIPSILSIAGTATLGVLTNRGIRLFQRGEAASLWHLIKNFLQNTANSAGRTIVRGVETSYHRITNWGTHPIDYAKLEDYHQISQPSTASKELPSTPSGQLCFPGLDALLEKHNGLEPAVTEAQRETSYARAEAEWFRDTQPLQVRHSVDPEDLFERPKFETSEDGGKTWHTLVID